MALIKQVAQRTFINKTTARAINDPSITALSDAEQAAFAKTVAALLEKEAVGLDVGSYRDAPPGLRIWCGATVETRDVVALMPWIEWAFNEAKAALAKAA